MSKIFLILCLIGCILIAGCANSEHKVTKNPMDSSTDTLRVKYFTSENCKMCGNTDVLLANLSTKYPGKFVVIRYDITANTTNRKEFLKYSRDIKFKTVPFIVINERNIFESYNEIMSNLEPSIAGTKRLI